MKRPYVKPTITRVPDRPDPSADNAGRIDLAYSGVRANGKKPSNSDVAVPRKESVDPAVAVTATVVCAYVSNNALPPGELPEFIIKIHASLKLISIGSPDVRRNGMKSVVQVKKSVTPEFIICLEDGKRFKSLKRHIMTQYGLTPDQYRAKWNLPSNYPMVAPNYSAARSNLAKTTGLGRRVK